MIAATIAPAIAAADTPTASPTHVKIEIDANSKCHVQAAAMDCGKVGPYLRDTMRLPDTTEIRPWVSRTAEYDATAKLISSLRDAGFHNLGFVADRNE